LVTDQEGRVILCRMTLTRRQFLAYGAGFAIQAGVSKENLIVRSSFPADLETPIHLLDSGWITPNHLHFVRTHLQTPRLNAATFSLTVEGEVERPLKLSMSDLRSFRETSQVVTLECSGNGRVYSQPPVPGLQWEKGAVGTARWTGVPLRDILNRAGVRAAGRNAVMNGADTPPGTTPDFIRSIPIEKALHPDTLLAYSMNGDAIPVEHGYPLRLIVPGWEAASSTKWLANVTLSPDETDNHFMRNAYRIPNRPVAPGTAVDPADMVPYTALDVKSIITSPLDGTAVRRGVAFELRGFAWAGEADITRVDVSVDYGRTWSAARLDRDRARYAWRRFRYMWRPDRRGSFVLLSRAADNQGRAQPAVPSWNPAGYLYNVIDKVRVNVET
jgi:DMSO/TMAO reductase YedYZ molybdopterin-dependent catalytic subunit